MPRTRNSSPQRQTYDYQHKLERDKWKPTVDAGNATCTEPVCLHRTRWIAPGTPWDLAHNRTTGGYRGPAHRRCNRAEGAAFGNRQRGTAKHNTQPWRSRHW